jgi:hypothetical protein
MLWCYGYFPERNSGVMITSHWNILVLWAPPSKILGFCVITSQRNILSSLLPTEIRCYGYFPERNSGVMITSYWNILVLWAPPSKILGFCDNFPAKYFIIITSHWNTVLWPLPREKFRWYDHFPLKYSGAVITSQSGILEFSLKCAGVMTISQWNILELRTLPHTGSVGHTATWQCAGPRRSCHVNMSNRAATEGGHCCNRVPGSGCGKARGWSYQLLEPLAGS